MAEGGTLFTQRILRRALSLFRRRRCTYPLHGHTLDFTALSRRTK